MRHRKPNPQTGIYQKPTIRKGNPTDFRENGNLAAGAWTNPKALALAEQEVQKIIANNTSLLSLSPIADIWVPPLLNKDKLPVCSCVKITNQSADIRCQKCYGVKLIPGYVKWGYNTLFFSAVDLGLHNSSQPGFNIPSTIVKNVSTTLQTLQLAPTTLTSSFETPDFGVNNTYAKYWELDYKIYNRAPGNFYTVEWSLDRGSTWLSGNFKELRLERGTIRFKITLSRTTLQAISPQFEILRFRYPILDAPYVHIGKPAGKRKKSREEWGTVVNEALAFWTVPLEGSAQINSQDVFNTPWLPDSNFIFLLREGSYAGDRFWAINNQRSEYYGVMTNQFFDTRKIQEDEIMDHVF